MINEPNHICKNINCHKGINGERKRYWACNSCDRTNNWKSVACSKECWEEYQKQVIEARSKGGTIDILPERLDMTKKEVETLLEKPLDVVLEETKEQLKDYANDDGTID